MDQSRNQLQARKQSNVSSTSSTIPWRPEDKKSLAIIIGRVFDLQKQFGKQTAQLETIVEGFLWVMEGYAPAEVARGFAEYIRRHSDMPTPCDIVKIIDPPVEEFRPDWDFYNRLKELLKHGGAYALNDDEFEYMRKCEANSIKKMKNSNPN